MDDLLQQGISAYKAGKRDEARKIFKTVVEQSPDSEQAWGWMNNVCDTDKEHIYCLNQLLHVNPNNEKAHHLLDQLLGSPLSSTPSNTQTSPSSDVKARRKNSSFTQAQLFILLGLIVMVFLLFGVAIWYMFV
jgi:hypothetical protein